MPPGGCVSRFPPPRRPMRCSRWRGARVRATRCRHALRGPRTAHRRTDARPCVIATRPRAPVVTVRARRPDRGPGDRDGLALRHDVLAGPGRPGPHRIDAALVGDAAAHPRTVASVETVARDSLVFHRSASLPAALEAIDWQRVYAVLDLSARRPTLYVASAAGASVARVLEQISAADPSVRVVDTHPLAATDPSGVNIFYLMLVTTIT